MITEKAACFCGNISADIAFSNPVDTYQPRACDCDFCEKHGASYLSDPNGKLTVRISDSDQIVSLQHGSGLADFMICRSCGVLFCVICTRNEYTVGSLNSLTLYNRRKLKPSLSISPKSLADTEKLERWSQLWFKDVIISKNKPMS